MSTCVLPGWDQTNVASQEWNPMLKNDWYKLICFLLWNLLHTFGCVSQQHFRFVLLWKHGWHIFSRNGNQDSGRSGTVLRDEMRASESEMIGWEWNGEGFGCQLSAHRKGILSTFSCKGAIIYSNEQGKLDTYSTCISLSWTTALLQRWGEVEECHPSIKSSFWS